MKCLGVLSFLFCGTYIKCVNFQNLIVVCFIFKRILANKDKGCLLAELHYHVIKYSEWYVTVLVANNLI